nr:immunoglobulin light chain junction region [Macaca mulatta]MPO00936.1 immunoglobulin light chain junction region [Macaca mulatta]MPO01367.1 immunoglobulin light chain junction region [Macaca mulatta]
GMQVLQTPFTF